MHIPPKAAAVGIYMSSTFNLGCREAEQARPEFPKTKHPLVRWYYSNEYRENLVKLEEHVTPDWLEVATKTLLGDLKGQAISRGGFTGWPVYLSLGRPQSNTWKWQSTYLPQFSGAIWAVSATPIDSPTRNDKQPANPSFLVISRPKAQWDSSDFQPSPEKPISGRGSSWAAAPLKTMELSLSCFATSRGDEPDTSKLRWGNCWSGNKKIETSMAPSENLQKDPTPDPLAVQMFFAQDKRYFLCAPRWTTWRSWST